MTGYQRRAGVSSTRSGPGGKEESGIADWGLLIADCGLGIGKPVAGVLGERHRAEPEADGGHCRLRRCRRFGGRIGKAEQVDGLNGRFAGDSPDLVEIGARRRGAAQVEVIDRPRGQIARTDALDVARRCIGFGLLVVFRIFFIVIGFEQRSAEVAAHAAAIERPVRSAREQPAQHDHVASDAAQAKHAGALGRKVVEVRDDRHFQPALAEQVGDDVLFELALLRASALPLRDDDRDAFGHGITSPENLVRQRVLPASSTPLPQNHSFI